MESGETEKTVHDVGVLKSNARELDAPHFSMIRRVYYGETGNEVPVMQELHVFQVEKVLRAVQVNVKGSVSMTRCMGRWIGRSF